MSKKIVQTAGRDALGAFAPEFAHFNDDILFGENWNDEDLDLKTRSLITVVALMAQGITDSSLKYHIMNAKAHGVRQKEMAAAITHRLLCRLAEGVGDIYAGKRSLRRGALNRGIQRRKNHGAPNRVRRGFLFHF